MFELISKISLFSEAISGRLFGQSLAQQKKTALRNRKTINSVFSSALIDGLFPYRSLEINE